MGGARLTHSDPSRSSLASSLATPSVAINPNPSNNCKAAMGGDGIQPSALCKGLAAKEQIDADDLSRKVGKHPVWAK